MNRIYQSIGIAYRARMVVSGDVLLSKIRNKAVSLVIVADDASLRTKKMYQDKCNFYHIPIVIYGSKENLSQAMGKTNNVAIGIENQGFAKKVYNQLKEVVS
jgi:ribosomal protein L7Ae-like RNA K-turn-binding protein